MINDKEILNQLNMEDNLKDQENQITSKAIRKLNTIILIKIFIFYRYLYKTN